MITKTVTVQIQSIDIIVVYLLDYKYYTVCLFRKPALESSIWCYLLKQVTCTIIEMDFK